MPFLVLLLPSPIPITRMPPRKTRTFNQWQSMQKAKSNGKGEKKFFFPACQLERARVLGFLAKHLAAIKGNKGSKGTFFIKVRQNMRSNYIPLKKSNDGKTK